jgi:putative nucleotidyltransferase with HDIG domain
MKYNILRTLVIGKVLLSGGIIVDDNNLFLEIEMHLLKDLMPSKYLNGMLEMKQFEEYPFTMLSSLSNVGQSEKYHPEGSVWNHTMLVVDEAAQKRNVSENPRAFMWAALLHDIGKAPTTKVRKGRITAYGHEREGSHMASEFLKTYSDDYDFINDVVSLIRWHMEPLFLTKDLPFSNIDKMLQQVPLDEIALLSLCDRFGRGDMTDAKKADEQKGIDDFLKKCREIRSHSKV